MDQLENLNDINIDYLRIIYFRKYLNITQDDMAAKLKISQNTYKKYEINKRTIPKELIANLAKYYPHNRDWIVLGIGNISESKVDDKSINLSRAYRIHCAMLQSGKELDEVLYYLNISEEVFEDLIKRGVSRLKSINSDKSYLTWKNSYLQEAVIKYFKLREDWFYNGLGSPFLTK